MVLSVETVEFSERFGDEKAFEMIRAAGFDGVDYSFYGCKRRENPLAFDNYVDRAKTLRAKLDELGLVCRQAHAPLTMKFDTPKDDWLYTELARSFEFASVLGVKNIIVHTVTIPDDVKGVDFVEYNLAFYKSLEQYCRKFNLKISVENLFRKDKKHNNRIINKLGTPAEMNSFMSQLNSEYFNVCVDLGHAAITYEPDEFLLEMKPGLVAALHVQDSDYLTDVHTLPLLRQIDWNKVTSALAKTGYNGDFTLEVFRFFRAYEDDFLPCALKFAADTGRYLIDKTEKYKNI